MQRLIIRKFLYACLSILAIVTLTFILMKSIPGDPFQQEQALPTEIYQALRSYYGLNDPLSVQYFRYLKQLISLDFGPSLVYKGQNVTHIIRESFPVSALIGAMALTLALPLGLLAGVTAALKQNRWQDSCVTVIAVIGISLPSFVMATLLQYVFAIKLELFPIARWESFDHLVLPALALAFLPAAFIARMARTKMIEEMKQGYITAARAKGLSETKIIFSHALHNILTPVLSYVGALAASIMTGSFIVEKIFGIPGLGYWFVTSVSNRDYPMIMGITVFYCAILLLTTFLVDILTLYLDPRAAVTAENNQRMQSVNASPNI